MELSYPEWMTECSAMLDQLTDEELAVLCDEIRSAGAEQRVPEWLDDQSYFIKSIVVLSASATLASLVELRKGAAS